MLGKKAFLFIAKIWPKGPKTGKTKSWDGIHSTNQALRLYAQSYWAAREALTLLGASKETLDRFQLVFNGPVQSGFFPSWGQTGTETGLIQFNIYVKPNWTPCNRFIAVLPGLETGLSWFEPNPVADQPKPSHKSTYVVNSNTTTLKWYEAPHSAGVMSRHTDNKIKKYYIKI